MPQGKGTYGSQKGRPKNKKNIKSIASQMLQVKGRSMSDLGRMGNDSVAVPADDPSFGYSDNLFDPGRPASNVGGSDESYIDMASSAMQIPGSNPNVSGIRSISAKDKKSKKMKKIGKDKYKISSLKGKGLGGMKPGKRDISREQFVSPDQIFPAIAPYLETRGTFDASLERSKDIMTGYVTLTDPSSKPITNIGTWLNTVQPKSYFSNLLSKFGADKMALIAQMQKDHQAYITNFTPATRQVKMFQNTADDRLIAEYLGVHNQRMRIGKWSGDTFVPDKKVAVRGKKIAKGYEYERVQEA